MYMFTQKHAVNEEYVTEWRELRNSQFFRAAISWKKGNWSVATHLIFSRLRSNPSLALTLAFQFCDSLFVYFMLSGSKAANLESLTQKTGQTAFQSRLERTSARWAIFAVSEVNERRVRTADVLLSRNELGESAIEIIRAQRSVFASRS